MTFTDSFFVIQNFFRNFFRKCLLFIFIKLFSFYLNDYAKSEK